MFKKIIAGCLIAIFTPLFILLIFIFVSKSTILNPKFYINQISNKEISEKIINNTIISLTQNLSSQNIPVLGNEKFSKIVVATIDTNWIVEQFTILFGSIDNYLQNKTEIIEGVISFKPLKSNLQQELEKNIQHETEQLPQCSETESQEIISKIAQKNLEFELKCIPKNQTYDQFKNYISKLNPTLIILKIIPDEINLQVFGEKNYKLLNLLKTVNNFINQSLMLLIFINIVILLGIVFLIKEPNFLKYRYLATAIFIPSLLTLIFSVIIYSLSNLIIKNFIIPKDLTIQTISLFVDIFKVFINKFIIYAMFYSVFPFIVSIILYVYSEKLKKSND